MGGGFVQLALRRAPVVSEVFAAWKPLRDLSEHFLDQHTKSALEADGEGDFHRHQHRAGEGSDGGGHSHGDGHDLVARRQGGSANGATDTGAMGPLSSSQSARRIDSAGLPSVEEGDGGDDEDEDEDGDGDGDGDDQDGEGDGGKPRPEVDVL